MARPWANWGALPDGENVAVYEVINTSFNHLFVIARDSETAMAVAQSSGHARGLEEIHNDYYFRTARLIDIEAHDYLRDHASTIEVALKRRLQGTLHVIDGKVLVGTEVISK